MLTTTVNVAFALLTIDLLNCMNRTGVILKKRTYILSNQGIVIILCTAIAGVAAYNNHKLKKEATRVGSNESQHPESIPLASSSSTSKG